MKVKTRRRMGAFLIIAGVILLSATIALTAYNFYVDSKASEGIGEIVTQLEQEKSVQTEQPDFVLNPYMEMPVRKINGVDYIGTLSIPALKLELPVISDWSYPNLRIAPCRYNGSVYLDNMVIAAHNYNSHFGNLKKLSTGDAVIFTDADGNAFHYEIADMQILMPTAIENMVTGEWDLTLFTCTIGGRTRFTLRCDRTDDTVHMN